MTILIGKYEFEGPFVDLSELKEEPGLYAILYCEDEDYLLVQLSQADNIREQIELSPSSDCLTVGVVQIVACYTDNCGQRQRREMVDETLIEFEDQEEADCSSKDSLVRGA